MQDIIDPSTFQLTPVVWWCEQPCTGQWKGLEVMCLRVVGVAGCAVWIATCVPGLGGVEPGMDPRLTPVTEEVDIVIVEDVSALCTGRDCGG